MKISQKQEESIMERKLYLGVENFYVTAVNPTLEELKEMGIPATEEPIYVQKVKRDVNGVEQEFDQVSIRVFLDNKDDTNRIRTQANFNIIKDYQTSSSGKFAVLNKYGSSTWLEEQYVGSGKELPSNMSWFINEDIKKALRGEATFIDFIKALYNLPYVNQKSTPEEKEKGLASLGEADIKKLFAGDFSDMRKLIVVNGEGQKIGFLLGVRKVDDNYRQTLYGRMPLKSYVAATGKTTKLVEDVADAQANNAYADAIFDLNNTKLKEFDEVAHAASPDGSVGGGKSELEDDLPF